MVKLTVLSENVAGAGFLAEHGLSYLIEHKGTHVLFDTGGSDVFLHNASKLNLDIASKVGAIVLSHGHWDHGNGLEYLKGQTLITHPKSFIKRFRKNNGTTVGLAYSEEYYQKNFKLSISSGPLLISEGMWYLGEIPRTNNFEAQTTPFVDAANQPDFVPDDSALAIAHGQSMVLVTGCSHAGISNIISYAQKVTGIKNIKAVIGGFHLKKDNLQTRKTIEFFKELEIQNIYPSHCVALEALAAFHQEFKNRQVQTGMEILF
jgi:7,8-dihydropterin-6-yl-methyl-4-(beta-D-ribofuranosyl)aminobenzene 5'-phosphate synthase